MMAAADGSILESGFNPERIAAEAGVSRRTFYRYFPDKYEYSLAMFKAVLGNSYSAAAGEHIKTIPEYDMGDMRQVLRQSSDLYWKTIGLNETLLARLTLLTLAGNSPGVLATARVAYNEALDSYVPVWEALFDAWDLELREPWTTRSFAAMIGALVDGMVLRRVYDPDGFDDMLGEVSVALTPVLFRLRGDAIDGVEGIEERFADEVRRRWNESQSVQDSLKISESITGSLVKLLGERGLQHTTIEAIAIDTGFTSATVRAKGSVDQQVCDGVRVLLDDVAEELRFDSGLGRFDLDEITDRHRKRLRGTTEDNVHLFRAFFEIRLVGRSSEKTADAYRLLCEVHGDVLGLTDASSTEEIVTTEELVPEPVRFAEQTILQQLLGWSS